MKKSHFIPILFLFLSLVCMAAFRIIGSEVMPDGRLVEPFFLIPIGWLFLFIGIASGIIVLVKKYLI